MMRLFHFLVSVYIYLYVFPVRLWFFFKNRHILLNLYHHLLLRYNAGSYNLATYGYAGRILSSRSTLIYYREIVFFYWFSLLISRWDQHKTCSINRYTGDIRLTFLSIRNTSCIIFIWLWQNTLNTTPTENLNHDYLQQLFQRHIERMSKCPATSCVIYLFLSI